LPGVLGIEEGMTRLFVLAAGVMKGVLAAGVLSDELVADRALSLLRERLDDEGEMGTAGYKCCGTMSVTVIKNETLLR
jgi:hypothetical protein